MQVNSKTQCINHEDATSKRRDHSLCIKQLQLLLPIASAKIKKTEREVNAINVVFTIAAGNVGELSSFAAVYT